MKHPVWAIPVAGALLTPLVTWFPMLAGMVPALGLPRYPPAPGVDLWSLQTFWLVAIGSIAVIVGATDRWFGTYLGIAGVILWYRGLALDPTHTVVLAVAGLLMVALRQTPETYHRRIRRLLVLLGGFQAAYVIQQYAGYDLFWGPLYGATLAPTIQPLGTLGGVNAVMGYMAIIAPMMPLPLVGLVAILIFKSQCLGAISALTVGLMVHYRARWYIWGASAFALALGVYAHLGRATHHARSQIIAFALEDWAKTNPVTGYGLGGWAGRIPALQQERGFFPTPELWAEAHSEPVQWIVETGLVGTVLLALWLWSHRGMFVDPVWGGSVAALAVNAFTWHPLHIVSSALVGLIVVALASRPKECPCPITC